MKDYELRVIDHEVEMDCAELANRAEALLESYKDGDFDGVKRLLSSIHMWVNSLNDDIFNRIVFTPKEVD